MKQLFSNALLPQTAVFAPETQGHREIRGIAACERYDARDRKGVQGNEKAHRPFPSPAELTFPGNRAFSKILSSKTFSNVKESNSGIAARERCDARDRKGVRGNGKGHRPFPSPAELTFPGNKATNEGVSPDRQPELDILKVITIFMMIFMHLQEVVFSYTHNDRLFIENSWGILFCSNAFYLVGPFGFLFSMGCTIPFSRRNEPALNMRRGVMLTGTWLLLNALRMVPYAALNMTAENISYGTAYFRFLFANDVLFFDGMFFLLFGSLQAMRFSFRQMLCFFAGLFAIAQFVGDFGRFLPTWSHPFLAGFVDIHPISSFSLLNWGLVVMLGIGAGIFLKHCVNKTKLYAIACLAGAACTAVLLAILYRNGALDSEILRKTASNPLSCHSANPVSVAGALGGIALLLGIYHLIAQCLPNQILNGISRISKRILQIYFAHWLILPCLSFIPWMHNGEAGFCKIAFVALALYAVSFALAVAYGHLKSAVQKRITPLHS